MRRFLCTLTTAAFLGCTTGAAMAQSAVGNPGFEEATLGQAPPAVGNWASFFGGTPILDASVSPVAPRTGLSALHLQITGPSNAFVGVQQPVTGISPGASYTMKIWARTAGNINNAVEYRMEWQDANGTFIGDQFALTTRIDAALTSSYQQFTLPAVAPAGAARANLVLDLQTFQGAFNPLNPVFDTEVFIDDVEFIQTPGQNACCAANGSCTVRLIGSCPSGTTPLAAESTCTVNNCPQPVPPAACCSSNGACLMLEPSVCSGFGATPGAANSTCSPNLCPAGACRADFNNDGTRNVTDIFAFLTAWFAGCP